MISQGNGTAWPKEVPSYISSLYVVVSCLSGVGAPTRPPPDYYRCLLCPEAAVRWWLASSFPPAEKGGDGPQVILCWWTCLVGVFCSSSVTMSFKGHRNYCWSPSIYLSYVMLVHLAYWDRYGQCLLFLSRHDGFQGPQKWQVRISSAFVYLFIYICLYGLFMKCLLIILYILKTIHN